MNIQAHGPVGVSAPPTTSIMQQITGTCYRQQERIIAFAQALKGAADQTFGPIPDSSNGQSTGAKNSISRVQEVADAQTGIDNALDLLHRQIERFQAL